MKRKLIISGKEEFVQEIFGIDNEEFEEVKLFLDKDFSTLPLALQTLICDEELNTKQKILLSYILGTTAGIMQAEMQFNLIQTHISNRKEMRAQTQNGSITDANKKTAAM